MDELDLKKELKHLCAPSPTRTGMIDVPEFRVVMIDGAMEAGAAPAGSPGRKSTSQDREGAHSHDSHCC